MLGTVFVIWAGGGLYGIGERFSIVRRSLIFTAEVSFATYLWHWPLIILAEAMTMQPLTWPSKLLVLSLTFLLAWLSTRYVEQPFRFGFESVAQPRRIVAFGLAASLAMGLAAGGYLVVDQRYGSELARTSISPLSPKPVLAEGDKPRIYLLPCEPGLRESEVFECTFGAESSAKKVALIGDSHAMAISPILIDLAERFEFSLTTYFKSSCPFFTGTSSAPQTVEQVSCQEWNAELQETLASKEPFDHVFLMASDGVETAGATRQEAVKNYLDAWKVFTDTGTPVTVVREFPNMPGGVDCIVKNDVNSERCDLPLSELQSPDWMAELALEVEEGSVIDLVGRICPDEKCRMVIDNIVTYRDSNHITNTFAMHLAPVFQYELLQLRPDFFAPNYG